MVKTDILDYQAENRSGNVTAEQLRDVLDKYFKVVPEKAEDLQKNMEDPEYKLKARDEYGKDIEVKVSDLYKGTTQKPPTSDGPTVTINGETVTKEEFEKNPQNYLGKVVTNFKEDDGNTETVEKIDAEVSKKYRLYWIDFEDPKGDGTGKYGDGVGTMYLKTECISNYKVLTLDEENTADSPGIRIKQLNPGLYAEGKKPPTGDNMKAITWLLNENNWSGLKNNLKEGGIVQENINYIVGSPSVEMMMDSYNKYYGLTETPEPGPCTNGGARKKLVNNYETGMSGYQVGPGKSQLYDFYTASYTVQKDSEIGTMYFPGGFIYCWLSSPSSARSSGVYYINPNGGASVETGDYSNSNCLCPLVSLKPTTKLELE